LLPEGVSIVVCDTGKRRGLIDSEYNKRRSECERGVQLLRSFLPHIQALRDVSARDLAEYGDVLPPVIRRRCTHVVTENERVLSAVRALRLGDMEEVGHLMALSHASLRDDYQVSCAELDCLVEVANCAAGCLGARMTGAGFGGCTVNLVRAHAVDEFSHQVETEYHERMGTAPAIHVCEASQGAGEVTSAQRT
jgi:galactokinase